jgi:hypothetical protein
MPAGRLYLKPFGHGCALGLLDAAAVQADLPSPKRQKLEE